MSAFESLSRLPRPMYKTAQRGAAGRTDTWFTSALPDTSTKEGVTSSGPTIRKASPTDCQRAVRPERCANVASSAGR